MKAVILAGGFGTRLSEETDLRPKPLSEIGGKPIIWHIMKIYEAAGFNEFVICCGYKAGMIKNYFVNYFTENYDLTVDLASNDMQFHGNPSEKWKVHLVDTGLHTMTGGRVKRIRDYVGQETFSLTYGDGVADIDMRRVVAFHRANRRLATMTAVPSPGRFGVIDLAADGGVQSFREKPNNEAGWINGGFFVLEPAAIDFIDGDETSWEREPLVRLAAKGQLGAYSHTGFWKPMDTLRDKRELEQAWSTGQAPWKLW
jgi:glucose-1-phosphate cytidylyltransferase